MNSKPRATISIRKTTYDALRQHCSEIDESMSNVVERLLGNLLGPSIKKATSQPRSKTKTRGPVEPAWNTLSRRTGAARETERAMKPTPASAHLAPSRGWNFRF